MVREFDRSFLHGMFVASAIFVGSLLGIPHVAEFTGSPLALLRFPLGLALKFEGFGFTKDWASILSVLSMAIYLLVPAVAAAVQRISLSLFAFVSLLLFTLFHMHGCAQLASNLSS